MGGLFRAPFAVQQSSSLGAIRICIYRGWPLSPSLVPQLRYLESSVRAQYIPRRCCCLNSPDALFASPTATILHPFSSIFATYFSPTLSEDGKLRPYPVMCVSLMWRLVAEFLARHSASAELRPHCHSADGQGD